MWLIAVIWSENYQPPNYQNNKTCPQTACPFLLRNKKKVEKVA
jgi:hypothetical protein